MADKAVPPQIITTLHRVRKSDVSEVAKADYVGFSCGIDVDSTTDKSKIVALVRDGLIQTLNAKSFEVLDQFALPQSPEYGGIGRIVAISPEKYLVLTASGLALVSVHGARP